MELIVLKLKWGNGQIFVCFFFWMNFVSQPNNGFFLLRKEKVTFSAWSAVMQITLKIKWMSVEVNLFGSDEWNYNVILLKSTFGSRRDVCI